MNKIDSAKEYFDQVVDFNVTAYKAQPTSLPAAYNLANALFSMHEWLWHTYNKALKGTFHSARDFNAHTQNVCPAFKHIRDLANAAKHVSLSKSSTQASHISDTTSIESKWGEGVYGVSKYGRGVVVINDGGTKIDFENTADEVHDYWRQIIEELERQAEKNE